MSFTVIIPARLKSSRLPDKPLADICGAKGENSRSKGKFSRKDHKQTNYEPYSFKKKADGSFKKKSPRRA